MRNGIDAGSIVPSALSFKQSELLGPFGLALISFGLGLNALFPARLNAALLAFSLLAGGGAQLLSGLSAWARGRELTATAFSASGLFSLSLLALLPLPTLGFGSEPGTVALASYTLLWATFYAIITPALHRCGPKAGLSPAYALQSGALGLMALSLITHYSLLRHAGGLLQLGAGIMAARAALVTLSTAGETTRR
jgi:succinate-acetate transporter protein